MIKSHTNNTIAQVRGTQNITTIVSCATNQGHVCMFHTLEGDMKNLNLQVNFSKRKFGTNQC